MKITALLHYLPNDIRFDTVKQAEKPLKYDNMKAVLKENYKKKLTLKEFYSMRQEKDEETGSYLKRMETNARLLGLNDRDALEQTIDGLKPTLKKFVVGNIFKEFKELKMVISNCERFEFAHPKYRLDVKSKDLPKCFACGSNHKHDWNDCKRVRDSKPVLNYLTKTSNYIRVEQTHPVSLNNETVECIVDTGADVSVVSGSMIQLLNLELKECNNQVIGGGEPIDCLGITLIDVVIMGNRIDEHPFLVLNSGYPSHPIIGRDILRDILNCKLVGMSIN
eukprot:NODE_761_length_4121_cov_0.819741.p2 type:complete len:279 gc:universal NODE_761_length_4121_cov_0.819741:177-1013(+)